MVAPPDCGGATPGSFDLLSRERVNTRYLPGASFPDSLTVVHDLAAAVKGALDVLVAVPSHSFRSVLVEITPLLEPVARVAWATKGFELDTGKLPHQVAREVLGSERSMAVLSGPTFAREVGKGLPTAMTVASSSAEFASALAQGLSSNNFRAYTSTDIVGVEVGGAVKNVLAVGAGLSDGMGFGANTRIALITRGLVEMTRLGITLGAQRETFMGLAGLGDLVLTCTDDQSRNRRFGLLPRFRQDDGAGARRDRAGRRRLSRREGGPSRCAEGAGVDMPISIGHLSGAVREAAGERSRARADEPADQVGKRLTRAPEAVLTPGFVHHQRHRVRQVQAAIAGPHRNGQMLFARHPFEHFGRQPFVLGAEDEGIARLERYFRVGMRTRGFNDEWPGVAEHSEALIDVGVSAHVCQGVVIETRAANRFQADVETQWLHEMQPTSRIRAQTNDVAGVRRDLRLYQDYVEHSPAILRSPARALPETDRGTRCPRPAASRPRRSGC